MCRFVEDKRTIRVFGDLADLIDTCAIFEFTDEQIRRARDMSPADLTVDHPHPIPPFPFPRMCMVGSGGIIVLQQPLMDEVTGVLEFGVMVFEVTGKDPIFQTATCVVQSTQTDDDGRFPMEMRDHKGAWGTHYWEGDGAGNPFAMGSSLDPDPEEANAGNLLSRSTERLREVRARLRQTDDPDEIAQLEEARDALLETKAEHERLVAKVHEKTAELRQLGDQVVQHQRETLHDAFYLALQEVNWINHPDHFTVQVTSPDTENGPRKHKKKRRVRRLAERARHIVLTKGEIGAAWRRAHQGGTHAPPIPHLRRGHYRTLTASRFKEKQGQTIWVRATHVAGHCVEWRDGDVRYKVT